MSQLVFRHDYIFLMERFALFNLHFFFLTHDTLVPRAFPFEGKSTGNEVVSLFEALSPRLSVLRKKIVIISQKYDRDPSI